MQTKTCSTAGTRGPSDAAPLHLHEAALPERHVLRAAGSARSAAPVTLRLVAPGPPPLASVCGLHDGAAEMPVAASRVWQRRRCADGGATAARSLAMVRGTLQSPTSSAARHSLAITGISAGLCLRFRRAPAASPGRGRLRRVSTCRTTTNARSQRLCTLKVNGTFQ